jgi:hypothetical protein
MKSIFIFIISFTSICQAQTDQIVSNWIQPSTSSSPIGKYEKFELGFMLSSKIDQQISKFLYQNDTSGINPFDPNQLNFEALFISPTGKKIKRYGFYYKPFIENKVYDTWEPDTTSYNWRVRFAPNEIGKWKVSIQVTGKLIKNPIITEETFTCIASSHKGILKSSSNNSEVDRFLYYSETGEKFFAISNNVSSGGFLTYKPSQNKAHLKGVQQLIEVGGNFTRLDMQPQAALPDWPNIKNYNGKLDEMCAFDKMVELCEKNDVYFTIFRHHVELLDSYLNPGGPDWSGVSWFDNPYRTTFKLDRKIDYLTNEEAIKWQMISLRYVFSRWGYSPSFSFYGYSEIDNWCSGFLAEENKINSKFNQEEAILMLKSWFVNQKKYIQENLSETVLYANSYSKVPSQEKSTRFDGFFKNSDVIAIHDYATSKDANYKNRYESIKNYWEIYKKPIILEEMGIADNKLRIYCCTGIEYHNSIWSSSMMGSFGTGMDWWWNRGVHDFNYHLQLKHVQTFFNGEDFNQLKFSPQKWSDSKSVGKRKIENFSLVSENQERILGWVHNATFFWRNLGKDSPCIQEVLEKGKMTYSCFVGEGYDINNDGPGDYTNKTYEDDYTNKGGAQTISNENLDDNPIFEINNLRKSIGSEKNWYKIEFYSTNGKTLILETSLTQILPTNLFSTLKPHVPNLDKINPDYAYKISFIGKSKNKPGLK